MPPRRRPPERAEPHNQRIAAMGGLPPAHRDHPTTTGCEVSLSVHAVHTCSCVRTRLEAHAHARNLASLGLPRYNDRIVEGYLARDGEGIRTRRGQHDEIGCAVGVDPGLHGTRFEFHPIPGPVSSLHRDGGPELDAHLQHHGAAQHSPAQLACCHPLYSHHAFFGTDSSGPAWRGAMHAGDTHEYCLCRILALH